MVEGGHPPPFPSGVVARQRGGPCQREVRPPLLARRRDARAGPRQDSIDVLRQGAWATRQECGWGRVPLRGDWRRGRMGLLPLRGGWGAPVAESVLAPPGPIPNPVVTQRSAGEYWGGDPLGGEAAAGAPHPLLGAPVRPNPARGGAAAARWAHNPKVGGSNPPPATKIMTNAGT